MTAPDLPARFRTTLARLELVSAGTIYSYQPVASKGGAQSSPPKTGDPDPPHLRWRVAYLQAQSDGRRASVMAAAESELRDLTRRTQPVPETLETLPQRNGRICVLVDQGWPEVDVAREVRCAVGDVRRALRERNALREKGQRGPASAAGDADVQRRRERARRMRAGGQSFTAISLALGVSRSTVHADLNPERNAA